MPIRKGPRICRFGSDGGSNHRTGKSDRGLSLHNIDGRAATNRHSVSSERVIAGDDCQIRPPRRSPQFKAPVNFSVAQIHRDATEQAVDREALRGSRRCEFGSSRIRRPVKPALGSLRCAVCRESTPPR